MTSRLTLNLLAGLCVALAAARTHATEIVLHPQATTAGSVLYLGDLADIHATTPARVNELKTTPLMPAPPVGETRFLRVGQIRDLLASRGMALQGLRFGGADVVEIGKSLSPVSTTLQDAKYATLESSVEQAIVDYLESQTKLTRWQIELQPGSKTLRQIAQLQGALTVSGGKAPWLGRQQFTLRDSTNASVSIYANLQRLELAVVATRLIERGALVRRSDVQLQPQSNSLPASALTSIEEAIGKEARQTLTLGAPITQNQLNAPLLVERGETVSVYARTGGVLVKALAVAKQDGAAGDLVRLETLDGKQRFAARVSGRGELEVFATGVNVADVSLSNRSQTQTR